ncbi:MAG TPA: serine/threonine-protein kinase [Candidatus Bilamarchaeum sp.]|nr:serine/threonine-protein kinase [Candidatus Bilamarchaeum sp.]
MHERKKYEQPQHGERRRGFAGREAFAEAISHPRIGGFELQAILGKGGMSTVYLARDSHGREVALKAVGKRPEGDGLRYLDDWFVRECVANLILSHPNIIHAFEAGETRTHLYLSMEKLEGRTLHAHLSGHLGMGWDISRRFFIQFADALVEMHRAGVVHRDLKPENIMLAMGEGGLALKVLDFGLCHILDYGDVYPHVRGSRTGEPEVNPGTGEFGTPEFRPPEHDLLAPAWMPAFDIYSAGFVLYNMVAGVLPFPHTNRTEPEVRSSFYNAVHLEMRFPKPTELGVPVSIPTAAEDAIMACLDKNPLGRPQASELRAIFESC